MVTVTNRPADVTSFDTYAHELAMAQIEALDAAYARLAVRVERLVATLAEAEALVPVAVAAGQLRLVEGAA